MREIRHEELEVAGMPENWAMRVEVAEFLPSPDTVGYWVALVITTPDGTNHRELLNYFSNREAYEAGFRAGGEAAEDVLRRMSPSE